MKNYLKKLLALIRLWVFGPPYTCCHDKDEEKEKKSGSIAY